MAADRSRLLSEFQEVLTSYLDAGNEGALNRAYELGRESLGAGVGLLDLSDLEKRALVALIEAREGQLAASRVARAFDLINESLTPYEMTHRSFRETNASLQRLNSELVDRNEALARTHELVRAIVDTLGAGIVSVDGAGQVLLVNRGAVEILGGNPSGVPLESWIERFGLHRGDGSPLPVDMHPVVRARNGNEVEQLELQIRPPAGGEPRWVWASSRGLGPAAAAGRATVLLLTDVTRHKKLERQMIQAERARILALTAGTLVHDMKNVLAVVALEAEALREVDLPAEEARACSDRLQRAAQRGSGMLGRLLSLGQSGPSAAAPFDPGALLEDVLDMGRRLLPRSIETAIEIVTDPAPIVADRAEIEQCLMNLVINARDAMPDGGRLVLHAGRVAAPATALPGGPDWVELAVENTGTGMDEAVRARLFEPFFTTKGPGKGTGLGLVSVLALVDRNGGVMEVTSVLGKGSRFAMLFPPAEG